MYVRLEFAFSPVWPGPPDRPTEMPAPQIIEVPNGTHMLRYRGSLDVTLQTPRIAEVLWDVETQHYIATVLL